MPYEFRTIVTLKSFAWDEKENTLHAILVTIKSSETLLFVSKGLRLNMSDAIIQL